MELGSYAQFTDQFKRLSGLDLKCYKQTQMQRRIEQFIINNGFKSYLLFKDNLEKDPNLLTAFMRHLTINVSQFFRDTTQWDLLREKVIPLLVRGPGSLRIWSAGCSAGQEAYSLAILLQEYFPFVTYSILASDIDHGVLEQAKLGQYKDTELLTCPSISPQLLDKYFLKIADGYQVRARLKRNIHFQHRNLLFGLFESGFDLILCRNVVIYFTDETKSGLYQRFSHSLRPGGVLFTGSTEQVFNLAELQLKGLGPFMYQKLTTSV